MLKIGVNRQSRPMDAPDSMQRTEGRALIQRKYHGVGHGKVTRTIQSKGPMRVKRVEGKGKSGGFFQVSWFSFPLYDNRQERPIDAPDSMRALIAYR